MNEAIVGIVVSGIFIYFYWWLSGKTTKKEKRVHYPKSYKFWLPDNI